MTSATVQSLDRGADCAAMPTTVGDWRRSGGVQVVDFPEMLSIEQNESAQKQRTEL